MIRSMTAFARKEKQSHWGHAIWELRSVNNRYLDINFSLPDSLRYLEPLLRKKLIPHLHRGKIDIKLNYSPPNSSTIPSEIDENMANKIIKIYKKLADLTQNSSQLNPIELLHWPQVLKFSDSACETLQADLLALFLQALTDLCKMRAKEGKAIFALINQRLKKLHSLIKIVKKKLPSIISLQREKIVARLAYVNVNLDPNRLEQEMLLFIQKIDVAEELDRLQIHINEFTKLLKNQPQGKKMDFLLQELNREANTLAAKSLNADLSLSAVNLKVLIEEIREQIQNVE